MPCPRPETNSCLANVESAVPNQMIAPVENRNPRSAADVPPMPNAIQEVSTRDVKTATPREQISDVEQAPSLDRRDDDADINAVIQKNEIQEDATILETPTRTKAQAQSEAEATVGDQVFTSEVASQSEVTGESEKLSVADEKAELAASIRLEKTIRAIQATFEKPRFTTLELPESEDEVHVVLPPHKDANDSLNTTENTSNELEDIAVSPASAIVASSLSAQPTNSMPTNVTNVEVPTSRLIELKLFMKEARSTALHLSLSKKSEDEQIERVLKSQNEFKRESTSASKIESESHKADEPVVATNSTKRPSGSQRVSLLDRLCPMAALGLQQRSSDR